MHKGKFIVFEGVDGAGKSYQVKKLSDKIYEETGIKPYITHEQTDSPIGSLIHSIFQGRIKTDMRVICPLYAADRLDHLTNELNGITEKVNNGEIVISDRYYFSSYAYQSVDAPMDWIIECNKMASEILKPDINIYIDIDGRTAMERINQNRGDIEIMENQKRIDLTRANYFKSFELMQDSENIAIVNGMTTKEQVEKDIWNIVSKML